MTSPIEKQQNPQPIPAAPARRDWCCGSPITGPHAPGCAYEPTGPIDYEAPTQLAEPPATDPPSPGSEPAASSASTQEYGFSKPKEFDFWTPSGDRVRLRKLRKMQVLKMRLHDSLDGFSLDLLKDIGDDEAMSPEAEVEALNVLSNTDVFDRVLVAAVVCPKLILGDQALDDIEIEDKIAIFNAVLPEELQPAALEAQLDALKSVRTEPTPVVRDLPDGEAVRAEAE